MKADVFYQASVVNSIPLILVTSLKAVQTEDKAVVKLQQFEAKSGEWAAVGDNAGDIVKVYVGLGDHSEADAIAKVVTKLPSGCYQVDALLSERAAVLWALAQYRFDAYKKTETKPRILVLKQNMMSKVLAETSAVFKTRDLINTPANQMGPIALAKAVEEIAKLHGADFEVCVGETLLEANFPAIHAVGRAAAEAPRLASLTWGDETHPRVSLVGKGVCFDSGGLDLKPSRGMRLMKKDMGGAANAIGLAHWIMSIKLPVYLELFIPAVENAVSASSYRPGDVITMRNGLTVEIDNTDAEGRLVLADALTKACENKPDLLIDFATLTGAARIAVGTDITAMFSNDDAFAEGVSAYSGEMRDPVWRLPLHQKYTSLFESNIADLANSASSSYGGAITAALFLERFVTKDMTWMHCDLMAWNLKTTPGKPEGGEAMGIQAIAAYMIHRFS
ncbi:MAG: leucyl aminopeptidase family protein [Gammaproteobacteria bacterium]|nr:leucyl aminopeptidase family protein [Gammaproteobacteria bacterium]